MKKGKIIFLLCVFILFIKKVSGQKEHKISDAYEDIYLTTEVQAHLSEAVLFNISAGPHFNLNPKSVWKGDYQLGIKLGTDFGYKKTFLVAPKFTVQTMIDSFFYTKFSISYLTDFQVNDLRFTPEIGVGFWDLTYLTYGYDFYLDQQDIRFLSHHKITPGIQFW